MTAHAGLVGHSVATNLHVAEQDTSSFTAMSLSVSMGNECYVTDCFPSQTFDQGYFSPCGAGHALAGWDQGNCRDGWVSASRPRRDKRSETDKRADQIHLLPRVVGPAGLHLARERARLQRAVPRG